MRDLMLAGNRIAVIVRPKKKEEAHVRIERIIQYWENHLECELPRPVVLEGNVSAANLGLTESSIEWIRENCDTMLHNAAILKFDGTGPGAEPWITNFEGTQHVLDICDSCKIKQMHYVSTAYVCGKQEGTINETDFDDTLGFRNEYEKSKFAAEQLVRESTDFESVTIYRPVVIAGDSQNGFTSTYHGLYVYLRLFAMFIPEQARDENGRIRTEVKIPWNGDQSRNVVPVDWVSDVICEIFNNPNAHGQTYHIAPDVDKRLTPNQVIEACYEYFDSHGVEFIGEQQVPDNYNQPEYAARILDNVAIYQQYESCDPDFDTTNLKAATGHIKCPVIDKEMIHQYLKFGDEDSWGKRKPLKVAPRSASKSWTA